MSSPPSVACHPLSAAHYADQAFQISASVVENVELARDTYRVRFECPSLSAAILPGQFVMLRLSGTNDPLLARPFALYDTVLDGAGQPWGIDVVYLRVGRMTARLAEYQGGERVDLWGPLGNGFSSEPVDRLAMVAGGIGQTPFLALGREFLGGKGYGTLGRSVRASQQVTLCYGVRTAPLLAGEKDFRNAGIDLRIASDDGTIGHHGLVTDLLMQLLDEPFEGTTRIACCGPERMMEAVAGIANNRQVPCEVSLETPMACGVGICFSCVVKVKQPDGGWDYKRTCVDGPVFEAGEIVW